MYSGNALLKVCRKVRNIDVKNKKINRRNIIQEKIILKEIRDTYV